MLAGSKFETSGVRVRKYAAREPGQYTGSHLKSAGYGDDGDRTDIRTLLCTGRMFLRDLPG